MIARQPRELGITAASAIPGLLASPVGASADEQAHIAYAWGTRHRAATRSIPRSQWHSARLIPADNRQMVTQASYMSGYPPLFYAVEGVVLQTARAVDLSGPRVLYGTRLVAAVPSLLAVGYGLSLLSRSPLAAVP